MTIAAYRTSLPERGCRAHDDLHNFAAMKSFDGGRRINVATDLQAHTTGDASVVISELPSQQPYNSPRYAGYSILPHV